MGKSYYLTGTGRLHRRDNTLFYAQPQADGSTQSRFLPLADVDDIFVLGGMDANSSLYEFLGKSGVNVHFFDYYQNYCGSFFAKEHLLAGQTIVQQALFQANEKKRLLIARSILQAAAHNIRQNILYYAQRGKDLRPHVNAIEDLADTLPACRSVAELMGYEGRIRTVYYQAFEHIITHFSMNGRSKQPPENEVNSLISYGNMLLYATCAQQIYHTSLHPAIGFLHEPAFRRHSLALDIAEIFKPILIDKVIFSVMNKRQIQAQHFIREGAACLLHGKGKKIFVAAIRARLAETFYHKDLHRDVSWKMAIRLECHKLLRTIRHGEPYKPLKVWA
jgi:CRISPR-associated protein Cas1